MMTLSGYGRREWGAISIIAIVLAAVAAWLAWWWVIAIVALVWIAGAGFFRDPHRRVPTDLPPGSMLSPADGAISKVFRVDHHEATGGPAQIVRIFLSVLNVHINRAPCDGEVVGIRHTPGKYHDARTEISAQENESNLITLRISHGVGEAEGESHAGPDALGRSGSGSGSGGAGGGDVETLGVRQVSGAVARRIVCPLKVGDRLVRGQKFGMIKFGSTTELILPRPDDVEVLVKEGDKVKAGLTVLARLKPPSA